MEPMTVNGFKYSRYIYIYSYKTVIKAEQNALIEHTLVTKYSKQLLEILNKRWYG